MYILKKYWPQFKRHWVEIIYLSLVNTILSFNFPAVNELGSPFNIIWQITFIIAGSIIFICVFLYPEVYIPLVNLEFCNEFPNPQLAKNIFKTLIFIIMNLLWAYLWNINYHKASGTTYIIWYIHNIITLILMYRAVKIRENTRY